jgi:membrane associated rhomboid family serine protease
MGIYDRDYYRREGPSFSGSFNVRGSACKWIVIANVVVFVLQILLGGMRYRGGGVVEDWFQLNVQTVTEGQVWRLLTYAFLHDPSDPFHILFNMLILWFFGVAMEEIYGRHEFLAMYLTAAVVGGLGFVALNLSSNPLQPVVGASGAVTAVMVLYALHYPRRTILLMGILPIQVWLLVLLSVGWDVWNLLAMMRARAAFPGAQFLGPPIAFSVHVAGAAFAFAYYHGSWRITNWLPDLRSWQRSRTQSTVRLYREDPPTPVAVPAVASPPPVGDEQLEAKLDAVLEKVARSGKDSLTDGERQILLRASEVYKRRRS